MRNSLMGRCQKLSIVLENEAIEKLMLSKNVSNNKCAPKLVFFNEQKIEKDSDDFWHRKLKVKVWHFLTPPHYTNYQNSIILFCYFNFQAKIFSILYPLLENSTTRITIVFNGSEATLKEQKSQFFLVALMISIYKNQIYY